MKSVAGILAGLLLILSGCASNGPSFKNVDAFTDTSIVASANDTTFTANDLLDHYSVDFIIPNPLYGRGNTTPRRFDPNHRTTLFCRATLLDSISTNADIMLRCSTDSTLTVINTDCEKIYREKHLRDTMFRIRITIESGFSPKSMEPDHWALYLENARGTMIEPDIIEASAVSTLDDSVYSGYHREYFRKHILRREITCYFKQTTFFGEDLLGPRNPHLIFVMARDQKTVARIAWNRSSETPSLRITPKPDDEAVSFQPRQDYLGKPERKTGEQDN